MSEETLYLVVGGNPFKTSFTGIRSLGTFLSKEEAKKCVEENYDECGGLIQAFPVKTSLARGPGTWTNYATNR